MYCFVIEGNIWKAATANSHSLFVNAKREVLGVDLMVAITICIFL
jgi:hypothetical protein